MAEKTLLQKLLEIRKSIEYIQKTETGNQGAKYVDPAVLVKTIREKLDYNKILLVPSLHGSTIESISHPTTNKKDAVLFLFKSEMTYCFIDADNPEDKLPIPWFITGKHNTDPSMAGGSALTYFERYFLLKFFLIPTSKDDPEFFESKTAEKITENDIISLIEIIESKGYTNTDAVLSQYALKIAKVGDIKNLPHNKLGYAKEFFNDMDEKK